MNVSEAAAAILAAAGAIRDPQTDLPRIARDAAVAPVIESVVQQLDSQHRLLLGDARDLSSIPTASVHLVVTSPPYWTLKQYNNADGQLGHLGDYDTFLAQLDQVWSEVFRVLVPGGRLVCVVGDVCLSRRKNKGRHTVVPLHSSISEHCRRIGFDGLAPIIWHKIANAAFEANGNGAGFLGKPYEPNAVIKNDVEFILLLRKPGGYRAPALDTRLVSLITAENHRAWFQQIWSGITGASTRRHPAPFPMELASRLVRMFSFAGDTVLDPFVGTGTTSLGAARYGRNSLGIEIDQDYLALAEERLRHDLPSTAVLEVGKLPSAAAEAA
ncbi:MAG TPA: site-specific DNA-methyltransferase [Vitreimonas sp.]|nr:site-specific DNA-methyltransferase [Vitreimonas sp.]